MKSNSNELLSQSSLSSAPETAAYQDARQTMASPEASEKEGLRKRLLALKKKEERIKARVSFVHPSSDDVGEGEEDVEQQQPGVQSTVNANDASSDDHSLSTRSKSNDTTSSTESNFSSRDSSSSIQMNMGVGVAKEKCFSTPLAKLAAASKCSVGDSNSIGSVKPNREARTKLIFQEETQELFTDQPAAAASRQPENKDIVEGSRPAPPDLARHIVSNDVRNEDQGLNREAVGENQARQDICGQGGTDKNGVGDVVLQKTLKAEAVVAMETANSNDALTNDGSQMGYANVENILKSPKFDETSVIQPTQVIQSKKSKSKRRLTTPASSKTTLASFKTTLASSKTTPASSKGKLATPRSKLSTDLQSVSSIESSKSKAETLRGESSIKSSKPRTSKKRFIDGLDLDSIIVDGEPSKPDDDVNQSPHPQRHSQQQTTKPAINPVYQSPILAAAADWPEPLPGSAGRRSLRLRERSSLTPTITSSLTPTRPGVVVNSEDRPATTKAGRGRKRSLTESNDSKGKSGETTPKDGTLIQLFKKLKSEVSAQEWRNDQVGSGAEFSPKCGLLNDGQLDVEGKDALEDSPTPTFAEAAEKGIDESVTVGVVQYNGNSFQDIPSDVHLAVQSDALPSSGKGSEMKGFRLDILKSTEDDFEVNRGSKSDITKQFSASPSNSQGFAPLTATVSPFINKKSGKTKRRNCMSSISEVGAAENPSPDDDVLVQPDHNRSKAPIVPQATLSRALPSATLGSDEATRPPLHSNNPGLMGSTFQPNISECFTMGPQNLSTFGPPLTSKNHHRESFEPTTPTLFPPPRSPSEESSFAQDRASSPSTSSSTFGPNDDTMFIMKEGSSSENNNLEASSPGVDEDPYSLEKEFSAHSEGNVPEGVSQGFFPKSEAPPSTGLLKLQDPTGPSGPTDSSVTAISENIGLGNSAGSHRNEIASRQNDTNSHEKHTEPRPNLDVTDASSKSVTDDMSEGFVPNRPVTADVGVTFTRSKDFFETEAEINNNCPSLIFQERKLVPDSGPLSSNAKIDRIEFVNGVVFIASGNQLLLYRRVDEDVIRISPHFIICDFLVVDSPISESEVFILISSKPEGEEEGRLGCRLSLWTVSLNLNMLATEVQLCFGASEAIEGFLLVQHFENADVFVGSNRFDGVASLAKLSLIDTEREPISFSVDPLRRLKSTRISSLKMVENTESCLIGFVRGQIENGYLSFIQLWDANSGAPLLRCCHPLGRRFGDETLPDDDGPLLVRQHYDGLLFYYFKSNREAGSPLRVVAQNPCNGVSAPVLSFQSPKREGRSRYYSPRSWFCNDKVLGVERDENIVIWSAEKGNIVGEISMLKKSTDTFLSASFDRDNNFVIYEFDGQKMFLNFWKYSAD